MEATISLVERLKTDAHRGFNSRPRYYEHGDFVTYFISPKRCKAKRINSLITIYVDVENAELVGCKVKGIGRLMSTLKAACVIATDGKVVMGMLFLSAAALEDEHKEQVLELASKFGQAEVPLEQKVAA